MKIERFKRQVNTPRMPGARTALSVRATTAKLKRSCASQTALWPPGVEGLQEGQIGPDRDSVEPRHVGPTPAYSTNSGALYRKRSPGASTNFTICAAGR